MHLTQGVHRSVQIHRNGVSTVFGERRRTWGETIDRVARLAAGLAALGMKDGDRVGLVANNSDRYLETYYGVAWGAGVIVPGNTRWAEAEHVHALRDSGVGILILDASFVRFAEPFTAAGVGPLVYMDDGPAPGGMVHYEDLIARHAPAPDRCPSGPALAAIFYTGGTTGRSKGVMLSHGSLTASVLCAAPMRPQEPDAVFLHSPPMFHMADAGCIIGETMMGGSHVIIPGFTPAGVIDAIARDKVTALLLVPTMFAMLDAWVAEHPADLSSVRRVIYGASAISDDLLIRAMRLFPNAQFQQAYGQTELSPTASVLEARFHALEGPDAGKRRSAGRAIIGVDIKIAGEDLAELPVGQVGEILVRSPGCMLGYWNMPELTAETIVDGWLRTGDAGYMDEDGFLFVVDRVKDMVVSGGENVYSAEVENALARHPAVAECAVIGVPDERWGERVHAVLRLREGQVVTEQAIIDHCRTLIANYKCPRSVSFSDGPLPLSGAGKILKTELRKPFWEGRERQVG